MKASKKHIPSIRDTKRFSYPYDMELYNIHRLNSENADYIHIDLDCFLTDQEEVERYCRRLRECKKEEWENRKKLSKKIKTYSCLIIIFLFLCFCYTVCSLANWGSLLCILLFQGLGIAGIGYLICFLFEMIDDYAERESVYDCIPRNPYVERYLSEHEWYRYIELHMDDIPENKRQKIYDYLKGKIVFYEYDLKRFESLGIKI